METKTLEVREAKRSRLATARAWHVRPTQYRDWEITLYPQRRGRDGPIQGPIAGHRYVIGVDFALGIEGRDYDAAVMLDVDTEPCEQVAELYGHFGPENMAPQLLGLATWFNEALVVGESQGGGLTVLREMWALGYRRLYRRRRDNQDARPVTDELGYSRGTRSPTLPALQTALIERRLALRSERLVNQMAMLKWAKPKLDDETRLVEDDELRDVLESGRSPDLVRALEYAWLGVGDYPRIVREQVRQPAVPADLMSEMDDDEEDD